MNVISRLFFKATDHEQWRRNEFESGDTGPAQKWGEAPIRRSAGKFLWSCPSTFFGYKSTISRFGERFRGGQYSLVSFFFLLFSYSRCPPPRAQPFVKVWGHVPPCPMESAPLVTTHIRISGSFSRKLHSLEC